MSLNLNFKNQTQRKKEHGLRCRYCGQQGLEWRRTKGGRWRLYAPGATRPHVCKSYVPADDEEDDEDEDEDEES